MRIFGLVGKPLSHSWSRQYFEEKFRTQNIPDCSYHNFPMENVSGIKDFVAGNEAIAGLNVTLPFKAEVVRYMDILSLDAEAIQAVNCIRIHRTVKGLVLEGLNTDSPAFYKTILPFHKKIRKALVLGTGGASMAVRHALDLSGIEHTMVSRSSGNAQLIYEDLTPEIIREYHLIINATPAGMKGLETLFPPIPYEALTDSHILYDLVYNPAESIFLIRGKIAGANVMNGLEMLKIQAELSWDAWNS